MHSRHPIIAPLHRLMAFVQHVKIYRMIAPITREPEQTFWNMTINLLMDAAAIEWCKVFGSWNEDTHWTKVIPEAEHRQTRADLHAYLGMSASEWESYWRSIVNYRNQMTAHHDLKAAVPNFPHYDAALEAAYFMFTRIRALRDQDWMGGIPSDLNRWSSNVAGNMKSIVRKAFAASAELGSNIHG